MAKIGYTIIIENADYPGSELVGADVSGTNQSSFSRGQGFNPSYEEINSFRVRVPSNRPTTRLFVTFTPEGGPEDIRKAFAVNLRCMWDFKGCSTTSQILPEISE